MICKIKGLDIEYEIIGNGKPMLILHQSMIGHLEKLFDNEHNFKRIYLNYPGIGLSEVDGLTSSDDILEILLLFIELIIKNENFLIVGHSYSTYLARGILKKMQHQVDGVAMTCPVVEPDIKMRVLPKEKKYFIDNHFLSTLDDNDREILQSMVNQNKAVLTSLKNYCPSPSRLNTEFFDELKKIGKYGFKFSVDNLTNPFEKPSLIILGKHDYVVGFEEGLNLSFNFPRATVAILDQVGHSPFFENNALFKSLMLDWLNRIG